ncbi:Glucose dehydrogenase [FAD, quinone] [Orchesella cincta]|uniref:Glucose dehydrogenase [FAD, quinone] n=1 Tax=Orchesella cincta TaxID=48709 RepID=A0A1D2M1P9_ORCCI|nr:Glucose dehydrogenase [FAD, quinone] [Orchesella cincta]
MLGGSSATNFMIYMRGNPKDFDRWANISGDSRWRYSNVKKYFKKMENYHGIYKNDTKWHGKNGPLTVESVNFAPGLKEVFEAVNEWGYKILDLNTEQEEGFSTLDATQNRGRRRASSYSAYIEPILGRPNMRILRYSHVTKIHFDSELKARGVYFARNGTTFYVPVKKEVIVSGGTINSAQLLMLSGIGPSKHLKSVGIQPLVDLPVGRNLADHSMTVVGPFILNRAASLMLPRDVSLKSLVDFQVYGQGPLTSPMGLMGIGVTSTSSSPGWPNLLHVIDSMGIFDGFGPIIDGMFGSGSHYTNLVQNFSGLDAHSVLLTLGKPKSRGFIELRDSNPFSKPIIDPQYYSDEKNQDMLDMIEGYELIVNLYEKSKALGRKLGARLIEVQSCAKYGVKTRAYYECAIRTPILHLFHPVETCHMGKIGDPNAVVDSQLRVIGTKGLRVIDASVMPEITNANTNAPTIMIAGSRLRFNKTKLQPQL